MIEVTTDTRSTIIKLESGFWQAAGNAEFYEQHFAEDGLMVLPFEGGILHKAQVIEFVNKAEPWEDYRISEAVFIGISSEVLTLTYRAVGSRKGQSPYTALISSLYIRYNDTWYLLLHQQTPLNSQKRS